MLTYNDIVHFFIKTCVILQKYFMQFGNKVYDYKINIAMFTGDPSY